MLPDKFKWLETKGVLPKLVAAALQYLGVKEIPGAKNNPVIMDMAKGLGVQKIYASDEVSWCAVFINHLLRITGKPIDLKPKDKYDLLRALKTASLPVYEVVPKGQEKLGDLVLMKRAGGGHVTLWIAETPNGFFVGLGGNQSNSVTFSEFDQKRIEKVLRYYKTGIPASAQHYTMDNTGSVSTNEA